MFRPTASAPPGGAAVGAPATAASPSLQPPSPTPLRRSPRKATPLGPVPSPNRVTKQRTAAGSSSRSSKPAASTPESQTPSPSASGVLKPKHEFPDPDSADLALVPANTTTPARNAKPKRKRKAAGYAPPSTYAHLPPLTDILAPDLLVLFVGLNPGLRTAALGHAYAHPSNLFWKLLHSSGITPRLCSPTEDRDLPRLYGLGNTNIVSRPSRNGAELSKAEMDEGVDVLEEKTRGAGPRWFASSARDLGEHLAGAAREGDPEGGVPDEGENMGVVVKGEEGGDDAPREAWAGAKVFVATSTSGLAATLRPAEKERIWRELGEWCERRRAERNAGAF
ncbi:mismatch-specific thymine-DNA glycosylate [Colletotrichum tofieldiae]|nr:mismatch-specific thymine-DNA glycosylate [Colletotrichum tofieldiae]